jgi:hypothetical protein
LGLAYVRSGNTLIVAILAFALLTLAVFTVVVYGREHRVARGTTAA